MTAPSPRISLTPEIYARFTAYHRKELAWGIFHVWLDDGNYDIRPEPAPPNMTAEERDLWDIFRQLSPSQMARLAKRCG
jgi:hypothetical protein